MIDAGEGACESALYGDVVFATTLQDSLGLRPDYLLGQERIQEVSNKLNISQAEVLSNDFRPYLRLHIAIYREAAVDAEPEMSQDFRSLS